MFIGAFNNNICFLKITNINKRRIYFKRFIDLSVIPSFIQQVIPYINESTTSTGFRWTEFVTIIISIGGDIFFIILDLETAMISKPVFVD